MVLPKTGDIAHSLSPAADDVAQQEIIDPIWTYYFDGRPMEINRAFCGYSLDEWRLGGKEFFKQIFTADSTATFPNQWTSTNFVRSYRNSITIGPSITMPRDDVMY